MIEIKITLIEIKTELTWDQDVEKGSVKEKEVITSFLTHVFTTSLVESLVERLRQSNEVYFTRYSLLLTVGHEPLGMQSNSYEKVETSKYLSFLQRKVRREYERV